MPKFQQRHVIVFGVFCVFFFWVIDAVIDALLYHEGTLVEQFLIPPGHDIWRRSLFSVFLAIFTACVCVIFRQRDRLEEELAAALTLAAEERAKSDAIVAAIGDGISIQDMNFRVLYQNRVHRELAGGDFIGALCYQVYDKRDAPCPGCPVAKAFADGRVHKLVKTLPPGREVSHIEITASPLKDRDGKIIAGIEVVRDISLQVQAEEAVKHHAQFLQTLIDTIPYPVFYKDASFAFLGCNQAFAESTGFTRSTVIGRRVHDFLPADFAEMYDKTDRQLMQNPGVQTYESVLLCGNGELRDAIFKKATYTDSEGAPAGIVCVVVDITERKRTETAIRELNEDLARKATDLEAANRELESFSYSVTHDLRKPLTIIYTAAQALRDECRIEGDETAAYFIQTICDGSRRMDELIEALQILTHVSRSGMTVATVDLSMLVEEIFADLRLMAPERAIDREVPQGVTAVGDPRLLRVLLENLLGNAWKYTGKCREARISFGIAQTPHGEAYFVRDNGAGFDMSRAGELFKPFVRLHSPREFPGTGVGLATVQRIVERHGGRIWAESGVGNGTTFYFTLPEPQPQFD